MVTLNPQTETVLKMIITVLSIHHIENGDNGRECGHVAMDIDTTTDREGATTLIELSTQSQ